MPRPPVVERLDTLTAELTDLYGIEALLQWDQEVGLPARAVHDRAQQLATMRTVIHRRETDPELRRLVEEAQGLDDLPDADRGLVRLVGRLVRQASLLPEDFVAELARTTSAAFAVWVEARQRADFAHFAPHLATIVALCRQKAELLGFPEHPYDALLDLHEEGLTTRAVTELFAGLGPRLAAMLARAANQPRTRLALSPPFTVPLQEAFAERLLARIGFDFQRGRQDRSAHPFSTTIGHHDRRVTNRYRPDSIEFVLSALHEGGHALYEQGISDALARSPLDQGVSLGIHESQSRLWENIIGRSRPFWEGLFPDLVAFFAPRFDGLDLETFLAAINAVAPGPIRVEADEVSYNLHILVRFELEKALVEGSLAVADLPAVWNERYRQLLGVAVDDDAQGVLQDVHWSHGSFGYFPTYTLGNLAAAQFWQAYQEVDPDPNATLRQGQLGRIREWLAAAIHRHGAIYPPDELLRRVTGQPLTTGPFLGYLAGKYPDLVP
ncbi:MAG: carboxypeptidase M32 [Thermodesulfobacteriota bacterium]